jgi:alpha-1,6-mannosyltransferase
MPRAGAGRATPPQRRVIDSINVLRIMPKVGNRPPAAALQAAVRPPPSSAEDPPRVHIADITMFYAPTSGGVRSYLTNKHQYLSAQAGIAHSIVVPGGTASHNGDIHTLPAPPLGRTGYRAPLRGAPWTQALCCLRPDLIEAGDPYRLAWAALAAGQRLGVPVVGFYHSDLPRLLETRFGGPARRLAVRYVRRLYEHFTEVLAPSRAMAKQLRAMGIERVGVQPLGVDTHAFHPRHADSALRQRLGLARDARLLVFAGRAAREKNLPLLRAAARALGPAYHLLLIGPGMPRGREGNVTGIDTFMPSDQLASHLAACDAFIHAGTQETFGLVVLEAMASGLPVIGMHAGAVPELVVPGTGVLAGQATRDGLVDATQTLFSLDAVALGRRARCHVEDRYAWPQTLATLLATYRRLLAGTVQHPGKWHVGP